jgi:nucleoid DNA-binding protein
MLSQQVGHRLELSHRHVDTVLVQTFSTIAQKLSEHEPVAVKHFGKFEVRFRKGWLGKHPVSGRHTSIDGRYFVSFSPGKKLKEKVAGSKGREQ